MTLKELRQQRSQKATRGKAALADLNALNTKAAAGALTDDETARVAALEAEIDALEAEVTALDAKIETEEKAARRGALFATSTITPPGARAAGQAARTFGEPTPGMSGFKGLSEFALAVRTAMTGGGADPRLANIDGAPELGAAPTGFQQNAGASGEGFLVPQDFRQQIWELTFEQPDLLSMVTPEPTVGNSVTMPKDESTPWGASGVQAYWRSEARN
jgi:HK97 family phage major capsid protein